MRKDIKFGVTVGGILLATIVVYAIVLSSGGTPANHSDNKTVATGDGTVTPVMPPDSTTSGGIPPASANGSTPSSITPHADKPALPPAPMSVTSSNLTPTDVRSTESRPAANDSRANENRAGGVSAPLIADNPGASTQPSVSSQDGFDWNSALATGVSLSASANPQRTETPNITRRTAGSNGNGSGGSTSSAGAARSRGVEPVMIDALPTTQPDAVAGADVGPPSLRTSPASLSAPSGASIDTPGGAETSASGPRTHVIASGENLWSIAVAAYGDAKYLNKITAANPGVDAKHLKVGKSLIIPALSDAEKKPKSAAASGSAANAPAANEKIDTATQYVVVSGDSLEKIARKLYDKPEMKDKLYQTNKTLIGANENVLKVGWVLKLPEPPIKQ